MEKKDWAMLAFAAFLLILMPVACSNDRQAKDDAAFRRAIESAFEK